MHQSKTNRLEYVLKDLQNDLIFISSLVEQMGSKVSNVKVTCIEALTICHHEHRKKDTP